MKKNFQQLVDELERWGAEPRQVLEDTFLNDVNFYQSCLEKFSTEANNFLETLKTSIVSEKKDEAIRAVHTLKGNADYLGLFPLMDEAMTILTDLRNGRMENALANLPMLRMAYTSLNKILEHE